MTHSIPKMSITDVEILAYAGKRYPNLIICRYKKTDATTVQCAINAILPQLPHPFTPDLVTEMHVLWFRSDLSVNSAASLYLDGLCEALHTCGSPWRVADGLGTLDYFKSTEPLVLQNNPRVHAAIYAQSFVTRLIPVPLTELV